MRKFLLSFLFFFLSGYSLVSASYSLPNFEGSGFSLAPNTTGGGYLFTNYSSGSYEVYFDTLACSLITASSSGQLQNHLVRNYSAGYSLAVDSNARVLLTPQSNGDLRLSTKFDYSENGNLFSRSSDFEHLMFDFSLTGSLNPTICVNIRWIASSSPTVGGVYIYKIKAFYYYSNEFVYPYENYFTSYSSLGKSQAPGIMGGSYSFLGAQAYVSNNTSFSGYVYQGNTGATNGTNELNSLTLSGFLGDTSRTNGLLNFFDITTFVDAIDGNYSGTTADGSASFYSQCTSWTQIGCYFKGFGDYVYSWFPNFFGAGGWFEVHNFSNTGTGELASYTGCTTINENLTYRDITNPDSIYFSSSKSFIQYFFDILNSFFSLGAVAKKTVLPTESVCLFGTVYSVPTTPYFDISASGSLFLNHYNQKFGISDGYVDTGSVQNFLDLLFVFVFTAGFLWSIRPLFVYQI